MIQVRGPHVLWQVMSRAADSRVVRIFENGIGSAGCNPAHRLTTVDESGTGRCQQFNWMSNTTIRFHWGGATVNQWTLVCSRWND